jgi:hypothetical protein
MDTPNKFALTTDLLTRLAETPTVLPPSAPALPTLSEVLAEFSPLPEAAMFLGVAEDGLPVLLNLQDPVPGPLLITGDAESGKTRLLQTIARAADRLRPSQNLRFAAITAAPDDWRYLRAARNCDGILAPQDPQLGAYLEALVHWTHSNSGDSQFVLLLIDDLDAALSLSNSPEQLRWLFLRGPARHVWPVVTLNPRRARALGSWLEAFRTRLFGHMAAQNAPEIAGTGSLDFSQLRPGSGFAIREGSEWLKFWIPRLD